MARRRRATMIYPMLRRSRSMGFIIAKRGSKNAPNGEVKACQIRK